MKKGREICHFGLTSYSRRGYSLYYGLYGKAPPGRGTFFRLQVHERVASPTVEVYVEGWGHLSFQSYLVPRGGGYSLHYGLNGEAPPGKGDLF